MRTVLATALCLLSAACADPQGPAPKLAFEERVAGCYQLRPGPWQSDTRLNSVFPVRVAPGRFRLRNQRVAGWKGLQNDSLPLFAVDAYPKPGEDGGMFTYWQRTRMGDAISIGYPLPFAGVSLHLSPAGQDLVGTITSFTDAIRENEPGVASAPVTAERIRCPEH